MDINRRDFLKIIGASTVATSLPGCTAREPRSLIPYIIPHEEIIPGRSVWYAGVCRECPAGCGTTIRVREGRATKAEGNPHHPVNEGGLCARGQAAIQGLYNPDRIQMPLRKKDTGGWEPLSWEQALAVLVGRLQDRPETGASQRPVWISPLVTGSQLRLTREWLALVRSTELLRFEPFNFKGTTESGRTLFNLPVVPSYDFERADCIISFGADFLETWLSPVEFARQFASRRGNAAGRRNHMAYFGPRLSMTAANADAWYDVRPDQYAAIALSMVHHILLEGKSKLQSAPERARIASVVRQFAPADVAAATGIAEEAIKDLALRFAQGTGLAASGGMDANPEASAATSLLNFVSGNIGETVSFARSMSVSELCTAADMETLTQRMDAGSVPVLLMHDVNPVYALAHGDAFAHAMEKVPFVVSFTSTMNETAALADLVLPIHTTIESWGDYEPRRGYVGLMQPAMQPVFQTKMLGDILLESGRQLGGGVGFAAPSFHEYVKNEWRIRHAKSGTGKSFNEFWVNALATGGYWEHTAEHGVSLSPNFAQALRRSLDAEDVRVAQFAVYAYPSIALYDGRGADKPWLQELPDPMSRLVWGSWAEVSSADAQRLGLAEGDGVAITRGGTRIELAVHVLPGLRPGMIAIPMGQGHTTFGRFANGVGVNPMPLLDPGTWVASGATIEKVSLRLPLASVQEAGTQHHREELQELTVADVNSAEGHHQEAQPSLYPEQEYPLHRWGMTIDVDKCTGCGACVTACYAENNIPVVGREEVIRGREMAWIRIDRYYDEGVTGDILATGAGFVPMLCQHCGSAPCETVCPVYAAYHTTEGLNGQVYNRCIGTRYCANNCPYKVRRFNWFGHDWNAPATWQLNPDVTVRTKGVMEKCTFCIQRIVEAKNNARLGSRALADGEVTTACQQSCPSRAIEFGDLKSENSRVSRSRALTNGRPYHVLGELNTGPAVTYLKKIKGREERHDS